jgi:hypothetical protein
LRDLCWYLVLVCQSSRLNGRDGLDMVFTRNIAAQDGNVEDCQYLTGEWRI